MKLPESGITRRIRNKTSKTKTPHLQIIRLSGSRDGPDLYGFINITHREAQFGTRKLVNIPLGYRKRLFRVTIPPGMRDGMILRLAGTGNKANDKKRGDIYLKVAIS
jgi:hypothetical protein